VVSKPLFSPDPDIEKQARKALQQIRAKKGREQADIKTAPSKPAPAAYQAVDVTSMQAGEVRCLGPEYVCHSISNELKFNEILMANGVSKHVLPLLEALVVGRLVCPGSERHTWHWAQSRSAIYELSGTPLRASRVAPATGCRWAEGPRGMLQN
jgi:hypothetical protein